MIGDSSRYRSIQKIGRGSCGTCWLAEDLQLGRLVVVKQVSLVDSATTSALRRSGSPRPLPDFLTPKLNAAMNEVCMLEDVDHVNIIKYYDNYVEEKRNTSTIELPSRPHKPTADLQGATTRTVSVEKIVSIVMEFASGGDLNTEIVRRRTLLLKNASGQKQPNQTPRFSGHVFKTNAQHFGDIDVWLIFIQVLLAVKYIHSRRILHRDLKTRNIFFTDQGVIKLGDFGIARQLTDEMAKTLVGSPYFMAPEIHRHLPYDEKSDIWSLGCVLFQICTLRHAFQGETMDVILQAILAYDKDVEKAKEEWKVLFRVPENQQTSSMKQTRDSAAPDSLIFLELVCRLLSVNPANRPSVSQIFNMPSVLKGYKKVIEGFEETQFPQFKHLHDYWRQSVQRKVFHLERALKDESLEAQLVPCRARRSKTAAKDQEIIAKESSTAVLGGTAGDADSEGITITKRKSAKVTTRVIKTTRRRSARQDEESPPPAAASARSPSEADARQTRVLDLMVVEEHESIEQGRLRIHGFRLEPLSVRDNNKVVKRKLHVIIDPLMSRESPTALKVPVWDKELSQFNEKKAIRERERAIFETQLMFIINPASLLALEEDYQPADDFPKDCVVPGRQSVEYRMPSSPIFGHREQQILTLHGKKQFTDNALEPLVESRSSLEDRSPLSLLSSNGDSLSGDGPSGLYAHTPHSARRSAEIDAAIASRIKGFNARTYTRATAGDSFSHGRAGSNGRQPSTLVLDSRRFLSTRRAAGGTSLDSPRGSDFCQSLARLAALQPASTEHLSGALSRTSLKAQSRLLPTSEMPPVGAASLEGERTGNLLLDGDDDGDGDETVSVANVVVRKKSAVSVSAAVKHHSYPDVSIFSGPSINLGPRPPLGTVVGRNSLTNHRSSLAATAARSPSLSQYPRGGLNTSALHPVMAGASEPPTQLPSVMSSCSSVSTYTSATPPDTIQLRPTVTVTSAHAFSQSTPPPTTQIVQPKLPKTEVRSATTKSSITALPRRSAATHNAAQAGSTTQGVGPSLTQPATYPPPSIAQSPRKLKDDLKRADIRGSMGQSPAPVSPSLPPAQTSPAPDGRRRQSPNRTRSLSPATVDRITSAARSPPSAATRRPSVRTALAAPRGPAFESTSARRLVRLGDSARPSTSTASPSPLRSPSTDTTGLPRKSPQRLVTNEAALPVPYIRNSHTRTTSGGSVRNATTSARQTLSPGQTPNSAGSNLSSTTAGSLHESSTRTHALKKADLAEANQLTSHSHI
eukprot:Gregarina_sp_Poly_1__1979@NODE_1519_length_3958_cov_115_361604_g61_i2_p1_GENE_NODE_1519_length_3958_cov_115_361604_g61_i2NODE_1519_length_3958_cov_115_361604_g61_i2_p1_ORF_typecomplete_len1258_score178_15Pkinase/PF00069_25/3_2e58Pkinase_Tyr/PF07714_17/1_6e36Kinaselike/PF14531_6/4_1e17Pkinase_fungal/PF17667_1/9_4e10Kdo/PF06293_14/0_00015WaaY/PF06176_11/0_24_NODE_1519_length_3958_cov_115_361604_g61_i21093882